MKRERDPDRSTVWTKARGWEWVWLVLEAEKGSELLGGGK